MKLLDILKTVGSGLISELPLGGTILGMVNGFLSDDNKLPNNATGQQAQTAIDTLSSTDKANVLSKEYDVQIEEIRADVSMFQALCEVDKTGNTTRPEIALDMSKIICFSVIAIVSLYCVAIGTGNEDMIQSIVSGWPFIVAVLGVPAGIVNSYFGKRTKEKQQKYQAASGVSAPLGILASLFKK